jgi:hypothetical protein
VTTTNERTSQNVGLLFKTAYRKHRISVLDYNKGTVSFRESQNQISETNNRYHNFFQIMDLKFEMKIWKTPTIIIKVIL